MTDIARRAFRIIRTLALAAGAACLGLSASLPTPARAQAALVQPAGPTAPGVATWSAQVNTTEWNRNLGVTMTRQGCSDSPAACVAFLNKVAQTTNVHAYLAVPLDATTTSANATLFSQLSLNAPFLVEVGIDDFVDQYRTMSGKVPQPASVVQQVIANLKSANPSLRFGATIYDDELTNPYLQDARLPAAVRAAFDDVHLYAHFRSNGPNFASSVQAAQQLFPNARIIGGSYAYDRRAYLPCSPGGQACTTQQELDLYTQTITIQAQLLASRQLDSIEFYPGYFGTEDQWPGWSGPRGCPPGELSNCIANTRTMRQTALSVLGGQQPTSGTHQVITTIAGNGGSGYSGDNGPGPAAQLSSPSGVAVDHSGNVFIVDPVAAVVRRVDIKGVIHTFAGNATGDNKCSGGVPAMIGLDNPQGIALDKAGNLYIADPGCAMVFKADASGKTVAAIAGGPQANLTGDGGPATNTQLVSPVGVAVDAAGSLYIADSGTNTIRTIDGKGLIHTLAGNGSADYTGDGGPATSAALSWPQAVAVDRAGKVYIADLGNNVIRAVDKAGTIQTFAGNGMAGYAGDEGPATLAQLDTPMGVAVDSSGGVYFTDSANNVVREVDGAGLIHTIAGNGTGGFGGDGGSALAAELALPAGLAEIDAGPVEYGSIRIEIADTVNNRVREISTPQVNVAAKNGESMMIGTN
jgi:sugar lactone lactonase YvrE